MTAKLAFLFLIYDKINCEELWYTFFKNVDPNKYSIYIHYKDNVQLKYFEKYKLTNCVNTSWGDISLVHAQNLLLNSAIKDPLNRHFIFLSNSCIPLKSFDNIYNLLDINYSYFAMCDQTHCFPRCNEVKQYLSIDNIQKSSQWCILNRKHSLIMINDNEVIKYFKNIFAADEHVYITLIYKNNLQNEIISSYKTTYTDWSSGQIMSYNTITTSLLNSLLNSQHLFGRKFNEKCQNTIMCNNYINYISNNNIKPINNMFFNYNKFIL